MNKVILPINFYSIKYTLRRYHFFLSYVGWWSNDFPLPRNFIEDPEKLFRKKKFVEARDKFESPSRTSSAAQASSSEEPAPTLEEEFEEQVEEQAEELGGNLAPVFKDMAEKTLREFSGPNNSKHSDWTSSQH